ncbi:MAG: DUF1549 domain-containing protein, partial [Planctomycetales bacterium]
MRRTTFPPLMVIMFAGILCTQIRAEEPVTTPSGQVKFTRHAAPTFSRLGCNGGACHGAVQGKNGFRLSLFGADPQADYEQIVRGEAGRRINLLAPQRSLLLLKATARIPHGGGKRMNVGDAGYQILLRWIRDQARLDPAEKSRVVRLRVEPIERTIPPGESYQLQVQAEFADGSTEDVTSLCSLRSLNPDVARLKDGKVIAVRPGEASLLIKYRSETVVASVVAPRPSKEPFPNVQPKNYIDAFILGKLKRLNIPPVGEADDSTFLRRASLHVAGEAPTPEEVRAFLADQAPDKRSKKIDELLNRSGHAAVWALKFCDILGAADFGVYADGMKKQVDAPRFHAWIRRRLEENTPYDEFAERILLAVSRDGKSLDDWSRDVLKMQEEYKAGREDLKLYAARKTLDLYWQRKAATGTTGALQVAHSFLGLRLECAQCHRHPHDVWSQDDFLSFANFFTRVRKVGFQGQNEKKF